MGTDFVPLVAAQAPLATVPEAALKLKVLSGPPSPAGFQPLLAQLPDRPSACGPAAAARASAKPAVTLLRDGDQVTHIRVQCVCGEVIELECLYPAQ